MLLAGVPHIPQVPAHVAEGVRHEPLRERERFDIRKVSLGHSVVSDPNPDWFGFNQVSESVSVSRSGFRIRIRIQEGNNYLQKYKKLR